MRAAISIVTGPTLGIVSTSLRKRCCQFIFGILTPAIASNKTSPLLETIVATNTHSANLVSSLSIC
ncbi:hypothetical protein D3C87_2117960 [compost metagenome]